MSGPGTMGPWRRESRDQGFLMAREGPWDPGTLARVFPPPGLPHGPGTLAASLHGGPA